MSQYCLLPSPLFEICARMFLFDASNHFLPFLCIRHTNSAVVIQDAALIETFLSYVSQYIDEPSIDWLIDLCLTPYQQYLRQNAFLYFQNQNSTASVK